MSNDKTVLGAGFAGGRFSAAAQGAAGDVRAPEAPPARSAAENSGEAAHRRAKRAAENT